ncbi:MAG: glycosyltransferase family 4 protein [Candidatus Lambdaproteobacteria bacterium]|nr:glycosyltransferase family 4 protein [Candidatus Lambdaproteobacteria bacterium]
MKVLISSYVHWWNAEAAYAAALAQTLSAAGHTVRLLTQPGTRNAQHLQTLGLPVDTSLPLHTSHPLRLALALRDLRRLLVRERIEIVNVFRSREQPLHLLAARGLPGLAVVRTRGNARPVRRHVLNRLSYGRCCGAVIASADVLRRELVEGLGVAPERVSTIYFPAGDAPPALPEARRDARAALLAELALHPQMLLIGLVGRVAREKGHRVLVQALAQVVRAVPRAVLVIVAKGYPGEVAERDAVTRLVEERGLTPHVRWLGFRDDIPRVMQALDVGAIPSLASELNCRVAMEFFAAGVPVVAFPTGALGEVVRHDRSGWLAADRSPEALAQALTAVLGDPHRRARLAAGALGEAAGRFSRANFLRATLEVYARALARG